MPGIVARIMFTVHAWRNSKMKDILVAGVVLFILLCVGYGVQPLLGRLFG